MGRKWIRRRDESSIDVQSVIDMIGQGKTLGIIAHELMTFKTIIRSICDKNNIRASRDIVSNGTSSYINEIKTIDEDINKVIFTPSKGNYLNERLVKSVNKEIERNYSYDEIVNRNKLTKEDLRILRSEYGVNLLAIFKSKRNNIILDLHDKGFDVKQIFKTNNKFLFIKNRMATETIINSVIDNKQTTMNLFN